MFDKDSVVVIFVSLASSLFLINSVVELPISWTQLVRHFSHPPSKRVDFRFSIDYYAGKVNYTTNSWVEKNKDEIPSKSAGLLKNSTLKSLVSIQRYIRSETRRRRGRVVRSLLNWSGCSSPTRPTAYRSASILPHHIVYPV